MQPDETPTAKRPSDRPSDVFIVGLPRSGTTVFRSWLAHSGGIDCNEIFTSNMERPHSYYGFLRRKMEADPSLLLPWNQRQVFEDFIADFHSKSNGLPLIIDTKYHTLNHVPQRFHPAVKRPFLFHYMKETGARMIQLVRRNKLRVIVSEEISKATGIWGLNKNRKRNLEFDKPRVTLNIPTTKRLLKRQSDLDIGIQDMFQNLPHYHLLTYEEMFGADGDFSDRSVAVANACLPKPVTDRNPNQEKFNPEPLSSLVENYDQVAQALKGGPFAWMLEETA